MPDFVLQGETRSEQGTKSARRVRRGGRLPAILYGHKEASISLSVSSEAFDQVLRAGARMVDLTVNQATTKALIKGVQMDPLGDRVLHVDFVRIAMDETIRLQVPLEVHGTPAGAKEGGVLSVLLHQVTVECLPGNIPASIRVRVDDLKINDALHLGAVSMPEGVKAVEGPETLVAMVYPPAAEEAAPTPAEEAAAPTSPEVISRRPAEEEGAEAAEE
jgi:large subunit ribosomal protein L25